MQRNFTFSITFGKILLCLLIFPTWLAAQPCTQGIAIKSILIGNASCGNKTGFINIQMEGNNKLFSYAWSPMVSDSTSAFDIPAGIYRVRIVRKNEPVCVIDTLLVVSNSDGPDFSVEEQYDPNCNATDGSIKLKPATGLSYNWNNGKQGPLLTGLGVSCHIVAATNPINGCVSYRRICLKPANRLKGDVEVLKPAKCGRATGEVRLKITGGYGVYKTTCTDTSLIIKGLTPGPKICVITDEISGCQALVDYSLPNVLPQGVIKPSPNPVKCPGGSDGYLIIGFEAGSNFALPFFPSLVNDKGVGVGFANLPAGDYTLYVTDADSCTLPPVTFKMTEPPPFKFNSSVLPESCTKGGQIKLSVSGGNGSKYIVEWNDLNGQKNSLQRDNLEAGRYSANIIDSLFCQVKTDTIKVPRVCARPDTIYGVLEVNTADVFCVKTPVGVNVTNMSFSLPGGVKTGASTFGSWELLENGCIFYTAKNKTGFAVDTICVSAKTGFQDLDKSTCIIVSISDNTPGRDTVYFTVQASKSATACGTLPATFKKPNIQLLGNQGLFGASGNFGVYSINDTSACITFHAGLQAGFNVDFINVMAYDPSLKQSKIICYVPTVLPSVDCTPFQFLNDSTTLVSINCAIPTNWCSPVPFNRILEYNILDNGKSFQGGIVGCNFGNVQGYQLTGLPSQGPFVLDSWEIDGKLNSSSFPDISALLPLMNNIDPTGKWTAQANILYGGNPSKTYGDLIIKLLNGEKRIFKLSSFQLARNAELELRTGPHRLQFRHITSGCVDTAYVNVLCVDCPPVVTYPTNAIGVIDWTTSNCGRDTVFCTAIANTDLKDYEISINGKPAPAIASCGGFIGFKLDTGFYNIAIKNKLSTCSYETKFFFHCEKVVNSKTANLNIFTSQQELWCIDTSVIASPIVNTYNACPASSNGNATWTLDVSKKCVWIKGETPGTDTLCLRICNNVGDCGAVLLIVNVTAKQDSLLAVRDKAVAIKNNPRDIPILKNDVFSGQIQVVLSTQPAQGSITFNASNGILTYTPTEGTCGPDSFRYEIRDPFGRSSSTTVSIEVLCDNILVFNGISPNNDGANDTWSIVGIEQFPDNVVRVFNRWGNLVFEGKNYQNASPWDGTWNGQLLPDGTYFYVIDLGNDTPTISGYLQILR